MKRKKAVTQALTAQEIHLLELLRRHPEMQDRVQSILEIVGNEEGPLKTADEVEELVIQELRRLGSATLHQWANQAEERVSAELQQQDPTVLSRKKKR
jgi:biotin carboxylase